MPSKLTQNITIKELQAQIEALKAELDKERRNNCVAYSEARMPPNGRAFCVQRARKDGGLAQRPSQRLGQS